MTSSSPELTLDMGQLRKWIGRTETVEDHIDARPARLMEATLDREPSASIGDPVPPFWHYLYFNAEVPASRLKEDGHEKLGRFLPPIDLPRRMWAGGRVTIHKPLRIGQQATKTSIIRDVIAKEGRSGSLCFVTVEHTFEADGEHCFTEVQDIVYREMPTSDSTPKQGTPAPRGADASRVIVTDPVMLFRYSALIFYGHRIHYDADYTRDVEGYPGLVVHGPLSVALLSDFGVEHTANRTLRSFDIRAHSPMFCGDSIHLEMKNEGDSVKTWARGDDGTLCMAVSLNFDSEKEGI
ncbi:MaoC family dehydratase N-terminal domain-containing protein [Pseudahrensia aquimaris]|uniref:MaoC family dehydratase N-terminal domain-containing protein n=1 Tax=Pseudahrensia aquimaris TaxID=744461 RepID=A0ABW3FFB1_9HYPH